MLRTRIKTFEDFGNSDIVIACWVGQTLILVGS